MTWKATDPLKERTKFVLEWEERWKAAEGGHVNMAELCRMFGVSRPTGYTWVERYRAGDHDLLAVKERSRRPKTSPTAISPKLEDLVVEARKAYPRWGPRKLHAMLVDRNPGISVPSASAMAKILKRRGLTRVRRRRRRSIPMGITAPFSGCELPNDVWCIDFKGWFRTNDQVKCYPLTLIDGFSRYLLRCEALIEPDGKQVQRILDSAFHEFGRPVAMRSDGGPPFASSGPAMLTTTMVWLLKLGITIEVIAPGKPQQNGRLERFHRTLQEETASPPAIDCAAQQRVFDKWRGEYNHVRPHEALGQRRPGIIYSASKLEYPCPRVEPFHDEPFGEVARVDKHGFIKWHRKRVMISSALRHELIDLEISRDVDGQWDVRWGEIYLGYLDEHRRERGLVPVRRKRGITVLSYAGY
jgi:putative transposase